MTQSQSLDVLTFTLFASVGKKNRQKRKDEHRKMPKNISFRKLS